MKGDGRIYQRWSVFWIEYWVRGKQFREPVGRNKAEAKRKLKARLREIHGDKFIGPQEERLTVGGLLDNLVLHLKTKGAKSVPSLESHLKPVRGYFAFTRAVDLTTAQVERFIQERRKDGKAPATVNRSTGGLRQALNLARKQGRLTRVLYVPMLKEDTNHWENGYP